MQWRQFILKIIIEMAEEPVVMLQTEIFKLRKNIFFWSKYLCGPCRCQAFYGLMC